MADKQRYGAGNFAVYHGVVYKAYENPPSDMVSPAREDEDPLPTGLTPDAYEPLRVFLAHPSQLEARYSASWTFSWRNEPFDVIGARETMITGWYMGKNYSFALEHLIGSSSSASSATSRWTRSPISLSTALTCWPNGRKHIHDRHPWPVAAHDHPIAGHPRARRLGNPVKG